LRLRNAHPAFSGTFDAVAPAPDRLVLTWTHGNQVARLEVDLTAMSASITASAAGGGDAAGWRTLPEVHA